MTFRTTASFAVICLGLGLSLTPAYALGLNLGANLGAVVHTGSGNGSSSSSTSTGLSLGVAAKGNLGLDGLLDGLTNTNSSDETATTGDASSSTDTDANTELNGVINLIQSSDWSSSSLNGMSFASASVTDTGAWVNSTNQADFTSALDSNSTDITELQAAITANADLSAYLDSEDVDASSVVALEIAADGSVELFTD